MLEYPHLWKPPNGDLSHENSGEHGTTWDFSVKNWNAHGDLTIENGGVTMKTWTKSLKNDEFIPSWWIRWRIVRLSIILLRILSKWEHTPKRILVFGQEIEEIHQPRVAKCGGVVPLYPKRSEVGAGSIRSSSTIIPRGKVWP